MGLELLEEELALRDHGAAAITPRDEVLAGRLVLEQVEDPDVRGDRFAANFLLEGGPQFLLPEVFLESIPAGEHPVPEFDLRASAAGDEHLGRDDQELP